MRAINLLVWLASALMVTAIDFPTTIELDVVFPRNETYSSTGTLPVVFAVQNAEAAFQFGYSITWTIKTLGSGTYGSFQNNHCLLKPSTTLGTSGAMLQPSMKVSPLSQGRTT